MQWRAIHLGVLLGLLVVGNVTFAYAANEAHELSLAPDGTVLVDSATTIHVRAGTDVDTLTWVVVDHPGKSIDAMKVILRLPSPMTATQGSFKFLGINGVGFATATLTDPQLVEYTATGIQPKATLSVIATFPKGYLDLPALTQAAVAVEGLHQLWLIASLLLPGIGLAVLGYLLLLQLIDRRIPSNTQSASTLPLGLSPALASIVFEDKIEAEAITATLLDLAQRGYVSIYNKADAFIMAKERDIDLTTPSFAVGDHAVHLSDEELVIAEKEGLRPYEKILLSKLFVAARPISSKEDVKVRIGHGLFSKKVAAMYEYLFTDASQAGYFVPHAARIHQRYLLLGWLLFAIGSAGFIAGAVTLPEPKSFLLFWAGLIGMAYLIVRLAPYVPLRSGRGREALAQLLVYRRELAQWAPIQDQVGIDQFYQQLPVAWALHAEHDWAQRFEGKVFTRPGWYFTTKPLDSAAAFVADIDHLVSFVAESFSNVREKTLA